MGRLTPSDLIYIAYNYPACRSGMTSNVSYIDTRKEYMLYTWGKIVYRWRWLILGIWMMILILAVPLGSLVTEELSSGFGRTNTESQRGLDVLDQDMGLTQSSVTVVYKSETSVYTDRDYKDEVARSLQNLASALPEVAGVMTPYNTGDPYMVSSDGKTIYVVVQLDQSLDDAMDGMGNLRDNLHSDSLSVWTTGGIPIFYDMNIVSEHDLRRAETVAFPLVMIVLIIVFGSLIAAGLPLMMGACSIVVTAALIYGLAQFTDMSLFVLNIATLLGLGVAVDYSLLVVNRFREELAKHDTENAIAITMSTAGKSVIFSAITSVLGLSGMLLFDFMMLRSLGIGGVTVMILSLSVALTLLPASISLLGPRVNSLRIFPTISGMRNFYFWHRLASWVMRHPLRVTVPLMLFLLVLGTPFLRVNLGAPWANILPEDVESRQGFDVLSEDIGHGEAGPIIIVYTSPTSVFEANNINALYEMTQNLSSNPAVGRSESIFSLYPGFTLTEYQERFADNLSQVDPISKQIISTYANSNATYIKVVPSFEIMSDETKELVRSIRAYEYGGDMTRYVTGGTADLMDSIEVIYGSFPTAVMFVLVSIYIALLLLFKSVVLPMKAVIMNGMSIFATYGAVVLIFQDGYFQSLLGIDTLGYVDAVLPVVLFCITFGISMDYEVFLLSRVKEIYDETGDNTSSVAYGLEKTGRIITSAALIMVLVCGSFALADIVIVKMFGIGLGLAILIDATLVRALLVPALMRIMGDFNWWAPFINNKKRPGTS